MPFFDDSGIRLEEHRGPVWSSIALIGEQVERFVALNIAWSLNMLPGILALAFPEWPLTLRLVMGLYSATVLAPATATLFAVVHRAAHEEYIGIETAREMLRRHALPSVRTVAPLYGTFLVLIWLTIQTTIRQIPVAGVILPTLVLSVSVVAMYWGPLAIQDSSATAASVLHQSVALFWREPGATLLSWFVCLIALIIGMVSIGGLVLIVPVTVAMLQIQLLRHVDPPGRTPIATSESRMMTNE